VGAALGPGPPMNAPDRGDGTLPRNLTELAERLTAESAARSLGERLSAVVTAAADLLRVESVGLLLLDDADRVRCVAATGDAAEVLERAQETLVVGPGVDALTGRETVAVTDLADEPRYEPLWSAVAGHGVRAVLAAPITLGGQVVGNLNALELQPHPWSAVQRRCAEAFAGIIGQMLGLAARQAVPTAGHNGREPGA